MIQKVVYLLLLNNFTPFCKNCHSHWTSPKLLLRLMSLFGAYQNGIVPENKMIYVLDWWNLAADCKGTGLSLANGRRIRHDNTSASAFQRDWWVICERVFEIATLYGSALAFTKDTEWESKIYIHEAIFELDDDYLIMRSIRNGGGVKILPLQMLFPTFYLIETTRKTTIQAESRPHSNPISASCRGSLKNYYFRRAKFCTPATSRRLHQEKHVIRKLNGFRRRHYETSAACSMKSFDLIWALCHDLWFWRKGSVKIPLP